jgi:hypothetical protein
MPSAAELLPGVPLIESPFFDEIFVEGAYDAEALRIAREFRTQGYAVVDFPDRAFDARADRIRCSLGERYDWDSWRTRKRDSLRLQDAWTFDDDVKAIALNSRILELLSTLYGRRAFPFQTLNFPVGTQQQIHSDAAHFSCSPERFMCGVWVALEDIGADQGPLVYYPGSHTWPVYTNEHLGVNASLLLRDFGQYPALQNLWTRLIRTHGAEPKRFFARKGQALIWAANLLHGGDRQLDLARTRWSQVTHYYFDGCCYYTPLSSDPFYGQIAFRDIRDVGTGQPVKHRVGGFDVPETFERTVRPKPLVRDDAFYARAGLPEGFVPAVYLKLNPDVATAGVDARNHFLEFGQRENRLWR